MLGRKQGPHDRIWQHVKKLSMCVGFAWIRTTTGTVDMGGVSTIVSSLTGNSLLNEDAREGASEWPSLFISLSFICWFGASIFTGLWFKTIVSDDKAGVVYRISYTSAD